ncbi:prolyl 4-hydroxylase subunit alpha-2 isoform X2 [Folsomia candida]|uniref:prolyl 4-hydroxylase subunit alpha-2 isoform X2 n=1 Tax=Folsomia candida TaxID=158441 RepID=UPI001605440A|nr:prolyl 4-hydroxylase subunit alpha-2 isoform X2 [Folsomia candida]
MDRQAAFPDESTYRDALQALLQLQYFYDLRPLDLIRGVIGTEHTSIEISKVEAQEIAEFSVNNDYFCIAMEWIKLLQKFEFGNNDTNLDGMGQRTPTELQVALIDKHDSNFEKNLGQGQAYMYTEKLGSHIEILPSSLKMTLSEESRKTGKEIMGTFGGGSFTYNHLALCNGQHFTKNEPQLYCWLDNKRHPYFAIAPLKMEILHYEPLLLRIYDIINQGWIKEIKEAATPHLSQAPDPGTSGNTLRTAIYAWLADEEIPGTPISRLIELIFNLNVRGSNASELLQVASYALGGSVSLHVDYLGGTKLANINVDIQDLVGAENSDDESDPDVLLRGDRVSTFLFYMNDVKLGGYTVFPKLNIFVRPIKGSAVFWYTSLRNGNVDSRMLHAACPIIYGHKLIGTKWVHQYENFLTRPCTTDPWA